MNSNTILCQREPTRRIIREKAIVGRAGKLQIGRTNFHRNYVLRDKRDPFIPNTGILRLVPVPLGPRSVGYIEAEVDALIDAMRAAAEENWEARAKELIREVEERKPHNRPPKRRRRRS